MIHIPLEIRVAGYNGEPFACAGFGCIRASAAIINGQGQVLAKLDSDDSYSVWCGGGTAIFQSENTGDNYYLAKRKKPRKGRLYFATDYEESDSKFQEHLKSIENYVLFTDNDTYFFWKPVGFPSEETVFGIHRMKTRFFNSWKHFYEIKKRKEKASLRH